MKIRPFAPDTKDAAAVHRRVKWAVLPVAVTLCCGTLCCGLLGFGTGVAGASRRAPLAARAPSFRPHELFKGDYIESGGHKVTAGGVIWYLSVTAVRSSTETSVSVMLTRPISKTSYESHDWSVHALPATSVTSPAKGTFKIDPPSTSTSPLMSVDVTFKNTSSTAAACKSGSETVYHGTISGKVKLVTGFSKLGTIGSTATVISFNSPNTAEVDNDCVPTTLPTCFDGYTVFAGSSGSTGGSGLTSLGAFSSGNSDTVSLGMTVPLSKPKNATRTDFLTAPEPRITLSGQTLTIPTSGSSFTGSATVSLTGGTKTFKSSCKLGTKKYTEKAVTYTSPHFTNHDLVAHMLVPGKVLLGSVLSSSATVNTY